jgi:hypothetical protein
MSGNNTTRGWTRRAVLAAGVMSGLPVLSGCSGSTDRAPTQPAGAASRAAAPSAAQDASFTALYTDSFDGDAAVLSADQRSQFADPSQFTTTSHFLEAVTETVVATATPESRALSRSLKHAIHNDFGYSPAEIRVLDRTTVLGNTYTAIFYRDACD